jgi:trehalose-6-phosphate synthase
MDRALEEAMEMSPEAREERLVRLRERVVSHDVHRWSRSFLQDAERAGADGH